MSNIFLTEPTLYFEIPSAINLAIRRTIKNKAIPLLVGNLKK